MEPIETYVERKKEELKSKPYLKEAKIVIVQVNNDPASNSYIKGKIRDLSEIGINYEHIKLSPNISQEDLLKIIDLLNKREDVHGFIVQLPLPKHIDERVIKTSVTPLKDIDGFNPLSSFVPATPKGILTYLEDQKFSFDSKNAVIIGRSEIVGKPMQQVLLNKNMNVTILHSKTLTNDMKFYLEHADLIIVAVGKPYFLKKDDFNLKDYCFVFDVGINRIFNKELNKDVLIGDCEKDLGVFFQSPVPKGVGLLTRLALLLNLEEAYKAFVRNKLKNKWKFRRIYGF